MNVGLKLDVLFVAGIYDTLTGGGEHKFRHLVKMWMGMAMRGLVGWDNCGPRAEDAPGYFQNSRIPVISPGCSCVHTGRR